MIVIDYGTGVIASVLNMLDFIGVNARTSRDPAIFFSTQGNYTGDPDRNIYGWTNEELQDVIAQGLVELDEDARRALYQRANEILVDELPMIQVATDPRTWVWSNKVHEVQIDLVGNITLYETWLA